MFKENQLESAEFYNRRYGTFTTKLIWPIMIAVLLTVLFLCFTKKEITVKAVGQIIPQSTLTTIQSANNSVITQNNLKENKVVHRGETLVVFNNQDTTISQINNQQKIDRTNRHLQALNTFKKSVEQGKNLFTTNDDYGYSDYLTDYQSQLDNLNRSNQEGIDEINQSDAEQKNKEKKINQSQQEANQKIQSLKAKTLASINQEIQSLKDSKLDLNSNQISLVNAANNAVLKAPTDGVQHSKGATTNSQYLPSGTEIAEIYPVLNEQTKLEVSFVVPANQINSLKINQKIRFHANQSGPKPLLLNGTINQIDEAPTNTKQGNVYTIRARLMPTQSELEEIRYGVEGTVSIITGKKTWLNYLRELILAK
ncbi:HlyD family efflux transporter periplasmic adaptor subunit [Fructobacillus fructosus]|uniref:HlyD family efflux transporter periplasmic adaptor subunit n=1 Tax=Fructobacillus fructosus TaxID=1631 RepID=UPI002D86A29E|nr:Multidrug resistance efflux pump EmrA (EmrA) [Fructobacillus fructosus]CAK1234594.1 Multidrug resistance efflux pump EmrA (EmrA) [Fructobacillus fructosus]CAK1236188.1 Multidrug resistance efflux pump EmrA (EmrA) [Fructobacillus fructosus]